MVLAHCFNFAYETQFYDISKAQVKSYDQSHTEKLFLNRQRKESLDCYLVERLSAAFNAINKK